MKWIAHFNNHLSCATAGGCLRRRLAVLVLAPRGRGNSGATLSVPVTDARGIRAGQAGVQDTVQGGARERWQPKGPQIVYVSRKSRSLPRTQRSVESLPFSIPSSKSV